MVVGPIPVDFPRARAEVTAGRGAPVVNRVMCGDEFVIATDVRGHRYFTCRRLGTEYFALVRKGPDDLNAEVDVHRRITLSRMMIKKTIVAAGAQVFVTAEKLPNEIKRRFPGAANISDEHAPPYGSERLRANGFCDHLIIHRRL